MKYGTFRFLKMLDLYLKKDDICFGITVPMQEMVAMSLYTLGSGDGLQSIGD